MSAPLVRHIVIGFDGLEDGHRATRWARGVALASPGTVLHLTHALALPAMPMHSPEFSAEEILSHAERAMRSELESVRAELTAAGITVEIHIRRWLPADTLIEQAEALGAAAIVVGQHGQRRARRLFIGSTSGEVSRGARVPAVVVRGALRPSPPRRILVGVDGSAGSQAALTAARALFANARFLLASLRDRDEGLTESALLHLAQSSGLEPARVELHAGAGDPAASLLELAGSAEVDLLCAGRRGRGVLLDLLLGSVSEKLLQLAPCPLLLAH